MVPANVLWGTTVISRGGEPWLKLLHQGTAFDKMPRLRIPSCFDRCFDVPRCCRLLRCPCCDFVAKMDADDVLAYRTARTVVIRDRWLGITSLTMKILILCYIAFSVVVQQKYRQLVPAVGTVRLQLQAPDLAFRWPDGKAPYCLGSNSSGLSNQYVFPEPGFYSLNPALFPDAAFLAPQLPCQYLDAVDEVPFPEENGALFIPTRVNTSLEVASPLPDCAELGHSYCAFTTVSMNTTFAADVEFYTLYIDHAFAVSGDGVSQNGIGLAGRLLDTEGKRVDPCAAYTSLPNTTAVQCPPYISLGRRGRRDIIALRTLMDAAGMPHGLDGVAGSSAAGLDSQTHRFAGMVLNVYIAYTNSFLAGDGSQAGTGSISQGVVEYTVTATLAADTDYKVQSATPVLGESPSALRFHYNRHGIRVNVLTTAHIGRFSLSALLVALTVSLGLLSASILVTDMCMMGCFKLRRIYASYKERVTPDFSDLREALTDEEISIFERERFLVDPLPPILAAALLRRRGEAATLRTASAKAAAAAAGARGGITFELRTSGGDAGGGHELIITSPPAGAAARVAGRMGGGGGVGGGGGSGASIASGYGHGLGSVFGGGGASVAGSAYDDDMSEVGSVAAGSVARPPPFTASSVQDASRPAAGAYYGGYGGSDASSAVAMRQPLLEQSVAPALAPPAVRFAPRPPPPAVAPTYVATQVASQSPAASRPLPLTLSGFGVGGASPAAGSGPARK